jgi:hypothetical protein
MDAEILELLKQTGKITEDAGRMLQRKPPFSLEELVNLQKIFENAAETIETIKSIVIIQNS